MTNTTRTQELTGQTLIRHGNLRNNPKYFQRRIKIPREVRGRIHMLVINDGRPRKDRVRVQDAYISICWNAIEDYALEATQKPSCENYELYIGTNWNGWQDINVYLTKSQINYLNEVSKSKYIHNASWALSQMFICYLDKYPEEKFTFL